MKYNLHTHSFYCGHGSGTIKEYADFAQASGYEVFGFSEHIPFPDNHFKSSRMDYSRKALYEADVNEEKNRLRQHLSYFEETMDMEGASGKKMGFIAQEIGREINTLGSKSNHPEMQKIVVKMKDELEQIKEQVLNVL